MQARSWSLADGAAGGVPGGMQTQSPLAPVHPLSTAKNKEVNISETNNNVLITSNVTVPGT